jgi:HEPN domain-containing protein
MKQREQALLFIKKACQDEALLAEVLSSKAVSNETFGFHCQQAAEKLLKAILSLHDMDFPRTHNLRFLMDLLADAGHRLPDAFSDLDMLTPYGTLFRYEDIPVETVIDREELLRLMRALKVYAQNQIPPMDK